MSLDPAVDHGLEMWVARIAVALCAASRWLVVVAIALTVLSAARLLLFPSEHLLARAGLSIVLAFGAMQVYLAVRIDIDRHLFELLAARAGEEPRLLAHLDRAMRALQLQSEAKMGRSLTERAQGLVSLVHRLGWLLVGQLAVLVAVAWFD